MTRLTPHGVDRALLGIPLDASHVERPSGPSSSEAMAHCHAIMLHNEANKTETLYRTIKEVPRGV